MRIAVVEPYLDGSHAAWANGYAASSRHDVEVLGLAGRHWKWRMHGAHVALAARLTASIEARGPFEALLVSSMANLAALLGLTRRAVCDAAVALYVHENQLTFPRSPHDEEDLTYPMINWTSMLAADAVVFNSAFHRDDWFGALPGMLRRFPDHRHIDLIDTVRARTCVAPVGIDLAAIRAHPRRRRGRPLLLWNQRWEHDQAPDDFVAALIELDRLDVDFDVAVAGDRAEATSEALVELRRLLPGRIVHDGRAEIDDYHRLLRSADVVVSTAHQEFFGVAITEAVAAGAFPVLPERVVYPERIPRRWHARCLFHDHEGLVDRLRWALEHRPAADAIAAELATTMALFDWGVVAAGYDRLVDELGDARRQPTGTA